MKPLDEKNFYEQLSNVPEIPCSIYANIEKKLFNRHLLHIKMFSVAAIMILLIGISSIVYMPQRDQSENFVTYDEEIFSELMLVHEYLNGHDIQDIEEDYLLSVVW